MKHETLLEQNILEMGMEPVTVLPTCFWDPLLDEGIVETTLTEKTAGTGEQTKMVDLTYSVGALLSELSALLGSSLATL